MNDSITAGTRPAAPLSQADASAGAPIAQQSTTQAAAAAQAGAEVTDNAAVIGGAVAAPRLAAAEAAQASADVADTAAGAVAEGEQRFATVQGEQAVATDGQAVAKAAAVPVAVSIAASHAGVEFAAAPVAAVAGDPASQGAQSADPAIVQGTATEGSTVTKAAAVAGAAPVAAAAVAATGDSQVDATADGSQSDDSAADPDAEPELTFEQRVDHLRDVVHSNPRFREIHFRTLEFCLEQRELGEVEQMIAALPEFKTCGQNQYRLILFMENAEGLERFELDEDGEIVTPERKEGLTDDEIDDLVLTYAFKTTDVGRAVYDEMRPQKRLNKLFSAFPKRVQAYRDVLEFCTQPRSFKDIDNLLAGSDVLKSGSLNTATNVSLQPSVFIDQLERNGGLVWDGSWNITAEGRRLLELAQEAK